MSSNKVAPDVEKVIDEVYELAQQDHSLDTHLPDKVHGASRSTLISMIYQLAGKVVAKS